MQNSRSGKFYRNGQVGRIILPHLSQVLFEYDSMCREHGEQNSFRHELASTLLAASRFSGAKWKVEAINRTKNLIENDCGSYLKHMTCVQRQLSYENVRNVARVGMCPAEVLSDAATSSPELLDLTRRFNAQRGDLVISFFGNLIRQVELIEAKADLMEWMPLGRDLSTRVC